jgi:hypothetical protein
MLYCVERHVDISIENRCLDRIIRKKYVSCQWSMQLRTTAGSDNMQLILHFQNFKNNPLFILHLLYSDSEIIRVMLGQNNPLLSFNFPFFNPSRLCYCFIFRSFSVSPKLPPPLTAPQVICSIRSSRVLSWSTYTFLPYTGTSTVNTLKQCFSTFVRPRPGKLFFYKTRARSQQIIGLQAIFMTGHK